MSCIDTEYFRARALVERQLADYAVSERAADAHRQMADAYEALVARFEAPKTTLSIVTSGSAPQASA